MELKVENISKRFGDKEVLKDIDFTAHPSSAIGLLGRNGAGKTTTIRIIMGVFCPDSGRVLVDGNPIDRKKIRIGFMPEERGLYPKKIINEQLVYLARLRGMTKGDAKKACDRWLDRLEMSEYKNKRLETLSKGNQQKIQLAATLMCDPEIVILDEPFSGLDPVNALLLKEVIKELISKGATVLFSSHQMNYIEEFCSRIAILNGGSIVLNDSINNIKRRYPRDKIAVTSLQSDQIISFVLQRLPEMILSADNVSGESNTVVIQLKQAEEKALLLSRLSEGGFDIDCFRVCEPSMNDIFVEYTEGKI